MKLKLRKVLPICLMLVIAFAAFAAPAVAHAASRSVHTTTAKEMKAYKRCLAVAQSYKKYPQRVKVNLSDLKLTKKQAEEVEELIWDNGELWWIDVFGLEPTAKSMTISFKYSDAKITSMKKKFEAAVKVALKRIGPGMDDATKVHMLHDYIIRAVKYKDKAKDAYTGLVNKRADCLGYTVVTDVLLRRAGLSTDIAWTSEKLSDHSWNLVKVNGTWLHVDVTWDRFYTYGLSAYTKRNEVCHVYLLQPDKVMLIDDHAGWKTHHACTNKKYVDYVYVEGTFTAHCKDYKKIVRSFTKGGLKYTVTGVKKVSVSKVASSYKKKKSLTVPAKVKYKNVTYTVNGIGAKAFAGAKAKTLYVKTTQLSKARVAKSLAGSKLKDVKVPKAKLKTYKKYFAKSNSGRKVKVSSASKTALRKA